ncbi:hypothetical protein R3P38DRAFT_3176515 [Favolaschia claudopus]|uniref:F-box domain-containing protein n=1 Tax=Favolaschia claudopus TaxID=2862362 RepID=A0AAW0D8L1_9AGAR
MNRHLGRPTQWHARTLHPPPPKLHPLSFPKILHKCIALLADSTPDLCSCALVARSWALPPRLDTAKPTPRRSRAGARLSMSRKAINKICGLPFTERLDAVTIYVMDEDMLYLLHAFKRLAGSARNIRCIELVIRVDSDSRKIGCFPGCLKYLESCLRVEHLYLIADVDLEKNAMHVLAVQDDTRPRIPLKSIRLKLRSPSNFLAQYALNEEDFRPFDISHITAVSVNDTSCFPWQAAPKNKIWLLDVVFQFHPLDLSPFKSLIILRIEVPKRIRSLLPLIHSLATIPSRNRIYIIRIYFELEDVTEDLEFNPDFCHSSIAPWRLPWRHGHTTAIHELPGNSNINGAGLLR